MTTCFGPWTAGEILDCFGPDARPEVHALVTRSKSFALGAGPTLEPMTMCGQCGGIGCYCWWNGDPLLNHFPVLQQRVVALHDILRQATTKLPGSVVCRLLMSFMPNDWNKVLFLIANNTPGVHIAGLPKVLRLLPEEQRLGALKTFL